MEKSGLVQEYKDHLIKLLNNKTTQINNCWIYDGFTTQKMPYPRVTFWGNVFMVHRLSAAIYLGLNLDDSEEHACHKTICPNKNCWNPEHLYVGDRSTNMQDTVKLRTHPETRKTHCARGHEYTPENTRIYERKRKCRTCNRINSAKQVRLKIVSKETKNLFNDMLNDVVTGEIYIPSGYRNRMQKIIDKIS